MSKIKNSLSVLCYDKKNTKLPLGFRWTIFLIFQLFVALLVIQPTAWAGLASLSVDADGDSVFNGENEKLVITFETDSFGDETQRYSYTISVVDKGKIDGGSDLRRNQTVQVMWDGKLEGQNEKLPDGDYTIHVELESPGVEEEVEDDGAEVIPAPTQVLELTARVTLDTKAPEISISLVDNEFSPLLNSLPVYYSLDEDVAETLLEFQRISGDTSIGSSIALSQESGRHTYYWNGKDGDLRPFSDGQYTLKLRVKDKGGNEAVTPKTESITIDSEAPRFTDISLNEGIPFVDGMFVNTPIQTISFTADAGGGTPIDLTGDETNIQIKHDADYINGTLSYGNKATLTLSNSLDESAENGSYEVTVSIADRVGNLAKRQLTFTFDNVAPIFKNVATNIGAFTSGSGIRGQMNFVEATLEDNIELNLDDSTIRLTGPSGSPVLGRQTRPSNNKIQWKFLSPLLAKDGLQDGQYTVEIVGSDKAGNKTQPIQISFLFDNLAPELVSLKPVRDGEPFTILGNTVYHNLPLNQFIATFNDGQFGTGVVFSGEQEPTRIVFGTPNPGGGINAIPGQSFPDTNNNVLTYILDSPLLKTDGSQDGNYVLNVTATDSLGNTKSYTYQIVYDTQLPTLNTTVPAANQTVSNLSEVVIKLNETTSGIDFGQSIFRLIRGVGANQVEIPVNISNNGTDTAMLALLQPIALDGSDDGTYTIEVTPTDLAGNIGAVVRRQFYLVSQTQPRVRLTIPETETVNSLSNITAEIANYIGSGVNFDASTITVRNAQGLIVPQAKVEADAANNQLTWSTEATIPQNGTADGEYTITATFVDFSGNQFTQRFPLILDTQFPAIDTVEVGTDPQRQLSIDSTTDVPESFTQITVAFDETDVDFKNTVASLTGPDGDEIALRRSNDGAGLLTLNFQNLAKLGTYSLTVTPRDNIGNVSETPFIYRFHLDIAVPVVTTVLIGGQSGAVVYVNESAGEIIATLADTTGTGIAVGEDESNIVVTSNIGLQVPGVTEINAQNQLIWRPIALPTDGSADGQYTVAVTPVDRAGRRGNVAYRSFIYDTQAPRITDATRITLHQPVSYIGGSLTHFQLTVEDVGPASLDLDNQTIVLEKKDGDAVQGQTTHDSINQLFFTLSAPLPTDGSADGEYTLKVDLVDKSGNLYQTDHNIFYDSQAPQISSVSLNTETPLNLTPYQVTDISESINKLTLNFVEATRVDFENTVISLIGPADTSVISLTLENNGVDQLTASFVSLTQGGLYTLSVTPQDIAGNTARGGVPYLFRLEFEVSGLLSVEANTVDTSVALNQHEIVEISAPINSLTLNFTDAMRIDFKNTRAVLTGPPDAQEISITQEDNEDSQLIVRFISLTQSGLYTLTVTPQDRSGNVAQSAIQYQFRLDIALPAVSSVLIDGKLSSATYVNSGDVNIVATFTEPTGVGLALDDNGSTIVVSNADGLPVSGATTSNGTDQLTWTPTALPTDGSADGKYTVAVTPVDKAGRMGDVAYRSFIYDTQAPRITDATRITLHQPVSYIGGSLTHFQFSIEDVGPASLDLDNQTISLQKKNSDAVLLGQITHDGVNQLFFTLSSPLPTDGRADGEYVLTVNLVDKAGNPYRVEHDIFYDSQAPQISSVSLNTETPLNLTPYQVTDLFESINKLTLNFVEATRVNFEDTEITLTGPGPSVIPLTLENNGVDQLIASFVSLTQDGLYTLSVTPQDIAGNTAQGAVLYPFRLEFEVPGLSSVKANTANASVDLTAYETIEISESVSSFTLQFTDATRADFENTIVRLVAENGQEIPVTLEDREGAALIVRFVSLTQSGVYTLAVTPQDIAGNTAQGAVLYPFRLEFEVPGLSSVKANTADTSVALNQHEIVEISESVSNLTLEFTDATQIDFVNTRVTLTGPDRQEIPITLEDDESQFVVRFVPLTQRGVYTLAVTQQDKAGNVAQSATQYQFRLDTALPAVSSVLIDGKPGSAVYVRNSTLRIVATITDPIGVGVLLGDEGSTITVTNPEGLAVSGTTTSNGTNQLTWTSTSLPTDGTADGRYTVAITPVDKSGRSGKVINRQFVYDTQAPRITAASPITLHAPVSYIRSGVDEFVLTIEDVGPADLDLASQVAALMDATEKPVSATLTRDELTNQLYLTLSKPFASDGSVDGAYSLNVHLIDKAGNTLTSRFSLVYDSKAPQVSSVEVSAAAGTPMPLVQNEVTELSESINTITIKFAEATLVNFANTQISLLDPNDQTIPLTREDDGISHMTLSFADLTQSGQYTLSVTPQDIAGNAAQSSMQFAFNLAFVLPGVESIIIGNTVTLGSGDIAYVNANNLQIVANLLDPAGTGLSFDTTTGSALQVATLDNVIVPGSIATNGTDVIVWEPVTLSNDGSSDGRYAVYVTPVDKKGREGNTIYREFVLDTQEPEITDADPIDLSQPISYIGDSLTQLRFTVQDVGPADLMLEDQKIGLRNQNGTIIPTKLTNDSNNQLFLTLDEPLPLDGSRDGEYIVVIAFSDKAGNVLSVEHPIIYDTQAPTLVSTVPADNAQLTEDIAQIQVNLNDEGGSGIDWDVTTVTLVDPNGTEISGELTSNGKTQLILKTNQLVADGRYTIRVQAIDRAGNGSKSVFETDFLLSRLLPDVISTSPSTAPKDEAYTNEKIEEIEVMLETEDVNHLSTLRLLNSENQVIAGQQSRESDRLIYSLVRPLATDGSEDGVYTIEFTPISASGRSGEVQRLTFTYDTQVPEVERETINLIVSEPDVNNSLIEIRVTLTDNQAGIDWENLDEEWLDFERLSPNAAEIAGRVSYETGEQDTLIFRLTVPLADDGSADGEYRVTVTPIDKAGNEDEAYKEVFTYDTSPPVIDPNSLLINDAPLLTDIDVEDYPSAVSTTGGVVIQANVSDAGLGVDLSRSQIVVRNPNGEEISGTTRQNGVDTIVFKSDGLNVEGRYKVAITGIGNDSELLGFVPKGSITTEFLYETTAPTAVLTNDGGKTEFTDEAVPFEGTATDPQGSRPRPQGEGDIPIPASGVWLVEIVGTGPDGQPIEPVPAEDESNAQEKPWSRWSLDFLPPRSGEYDLDLRVTDNAGNYAVYDVGKVTMSVSFSFRGNTFGWPNPLRHSKDDVAFFSFDLNAAAEERVEVTLYIYDWGGDMVYSKKYSNITPGQRNDTQIKWSLENQAGTAVARGLYVFRLEAVNGAGNRANAIGKVLVVD